MTRILVLLPLAALMGGGLLQLLLGRSLSRAAKGWLAFVSALLAGVSVLALLPTVVRQGAVEVELAGWDQGVGLLYRVDGLSMVFNLMATLIGAAILLYCVSYMEHEPAGTTRFYALMLAFIAGLVNLVSSANLLVAYVSWEIIGLCSYFLVGFWYQQAAAAQGARKVLVITHLAGYGFLAGILLLFLRSGSFIWTDSALQASFTSAIFLLFLVAAMAKSVVFPLHTWIPEAMNAPTPVSALLHSACYVKAGIYLIARMYSITAWQPAWNTLVLVLGVITMLVGALFALAQTDLKRLLAFSTISQLGHIITAFGLGTGLGLSAAVFYTISHGLFKATLFLCAGAVQHATGTRDLRKLGGLSARMPSVTRLWLIAAAAIIGVPLGNGFVAKWLLLNASLAAGQVLVVLVTWLVSVITAFYILKATAGVFYGDLPEWLAKRELQDAAPSMRFGMAFLAGLCLVFGVAPQLLVNSVVKPAVSALGFQSDLAVSWLGIQAGGSGLEITGGALILLAALLVAGLVLLAARPNRNAPAGIFTGGDPLPETAQPFTAVDFTEMVETAAQPIYRYSNPDGLYFRGWRALVSGAGWLSRTVSPAVDRFPLLLALAGVILIGILVFLGG